MTARLFERASQVDAALSETGLRYCFIGGIAVQRWGEPRSTQDLDLTVLAVFGGEGPVVDTLLGLYEPRIRDARAFALRHRVLLLRAEDTPIDIALGAMPFEEAAVSRATRFEVAPGIAFRTCGPSELIVHKAFAARDQDWIDVRGILVRSGALIDWDFVISEREMLVALKEDTTTLPRLRELRRTVSAE